MFSSKKYMPPPAPEAGGERSFLDIRMPEHVILETQSSTGEWVDHGRFARKAFERLADGTYVCSGHGGPLFLRCLRQDGSVIYVVDGGGQPFAYKLVPFPSGKYAAGYS